MVLIFKVLGESQCPTPNQNDRTRHDTTKCSTIQTTRNATRRDATRHKTRSQSAFIDRVEQSRLDQVGAVSQINTLGSANNLEDYRAWSLGTRWAC